MVGISSYNLSLWTRRSLTLSPHPPPPKKLLLNGIGLEQNIPPPKKKKEEEEVVMSCGIFWLISRLHNRQLFKMCFQAIRHICNQRDCNQMSVTHLNTLGCILFGRMKACSYKSYWKGQPFCWQVCFVSDRQPLKKANLFPIQLPIIWHYRKSYLDHSDILHLRKGHSFRFHICYVLCIGGGCYSPRWLLSNYIIYLEMSVLNKMGLICK